MHVHTFRSNLKRKIHVSAKTDLVSLCVDTFWII